MDLKRSLSYKTNVLYIWKLQLLKVRDGTKFKLKTMEEKGLKCLS